MCTACPTNTAECEGLEGATCFTSLSTCVTGAIQTANEFYSAYVAVNFKVSGTCSSPDANEITSLSCDLLRCGRQADHTL